MAKEIHKKDLYGIIGVSEQATEKEILKGYRKKALKCHPDKNPDNPKAAELFHELSKALEILTDVAARAAYDQSRKAKKLAEERTRVLDSKRKKFKEDLEARERAASEANQTVKAEEAERKLQAEIERLRKEGSRLLEQEQERLREELKKSSVDDDDGDIEQTEVPRIKLKWKAQKNDINNGGYNSDNLKNILSCYGKINALILSTKRNGGAIVEFESSGVSSDILDEVGLKENPFSIVWLSGKPTNDTDRDSFVDKDAGTAHNFAPWGTAGGFGGFSGVSFQFEQGNGGVNFSGSNYSSRKEGQKDLPVRNSDESDRDFESLVLMKMRQAEERKKLIEQMAKEDEDAG